jgi:phosphoglycerate dehydrogenase-like enzyme
LVAPARHRFRRPQAAVTAPPRVLVLGTSEGEPPPRIQDVHALADVTYALDGEALVGAIADAEVLFFWRPEAGLLEPAWPNARELRWIQSASAGVNSVLFPALVESEVVLTNARGVFDEPIAEYVLGLVIAFAKGFPATFDDQRRREWEYRLTEPVAGKQLLVVGPGPIGRAVGRVARALGMQVSAVGRTPRDGDGLFGTVRGRERLHEALAEADYVVDTMPLTDATRHMFDSAAFAAMRPSARFVNVGRGATVDQTALLEALREGQLAGAALDVFEEEPLPEDSPLWEMSNVIISPHMAGDVEGWEDEVVLLFAGNLRRWIAGEPLRNVVDKRLGHPPSE